MAEGHSLLDGRGVMMALRYYDDARVHLCLENGAKRYRFSLSEQRLRSQNKYILLHIALTKSTLFPPSGGRFSGKQQGIPPPIFKWLNGMLTNNQSAVRGWMRLTKKSPFRKTAREVGYGASQRNLQSGTTVTSTSWAVSSYAASGDFDSHTLPYC